MRATTDALLEREAELAALNDAVASAVSGEGRVVVIEGAAGIGKTSLLRALRASAADAGLRVLAARGTELEQTIPYGVARQLFERLLRRADAVERQELFAGAASLAAGVLCAPPQGDASGPPDEDTAFAVVHGLYWLASNLTDREPLVLAIDDLQWADVASLRWTAYLAARIEGLRLLVAGSMRPIASDADPALAALAADPATATIRPGPLSQDAAAVIVGERAAAAPSEELSAVAHRVTGGNPLLLRELAGTLSSDRGSDDVVADVERLAPEVIGRRVRLELAKLGPEATALARAVAVMGEDSSGSRAIRQLAGLDDEQAGRAALLLARAEVMRAGWPLRFVHPLVARAVYDAIPEPERGVAHAKAARLLSEAGAPTERVAAQLLRAAPDREPKTVEVLRDAARSALSAGAAESARAYLERALAEPPPQPVRADVLVELARAEELVGAPAAIDHLREAVALVDDPARRPAVRRELARSLIWRSEMEAAVGEVEAARREAPAAGSPDQRMLEADFYFAAMRVPDLYEAARARLMEIDIAEVSDPGAVALLALKAYATMLEGERLEEAVRDAERALSAGPLFHRAPTWALWGAVSALMHADRHEPALVGLDRALAQARRRGAAHLFASASMMRAILLWHAGALDEAEADARSSLDAPPGRDAVTTPIASMVLAHVLTERGMLDDASATLAAAAADGALAAAPGSFPLLSARAALRHAQGRYDAAAADAYAAGEVLEAVGFRNPALANWRSLAAVSLLAAGDAGEARRLASDELKLARRWGSGRSVGRALRVRGLAKGRTGLADLHEAVAVLERSPARLEHARAHVDLGSALRRAGKRAQARDVLRAGAELAERCGATALSERAREELLAAGARPRTAALRGVDSLTSSERRVAAMAAEGMSNREIAQALFVTVKAVEWHLSNAFRRLEITSRTQLVQTLTAEGHAAVRGV